MLPELSDPTHNYSPNPQDEDPESDGLSDDDPFIANTLAVNSRALSAESRLAAIRGRLEASSQLKRLRTQETIPKPGGRPTPTPEAASSMAPGARGVVCAVGDQGIGSSGDPSASSFKEQMRTHGKHTVVVVVLNCQMIVLYSS